LKQNYQVIITANPNNHLFEGTTMLNRADILGLIDDDQTRQAVSDALDDMESCASEVCDALENLEDSTNIEEIKDKVDTALKSATYLKDNLY
jgi:hypothetical protein